MLKFTIIANDQFIFCLASLWYMLLVLITDQSIFHV
jgi:hypothetical protein